MRALTRDFAITGALATGEADSMTHRVPLHVTVADLGDLPAVIEAIEGLGHPVECPVFDEWSRRRSRDEYLRLALALLDGTPWGRCVQLEAEIRRFEAVLWSHWRDRDTPPEPCSLLRRHLFNARRLGPLPSTARQIWNIAMKRRGRGNFGEASLKSTARDPA